MLPGTAGLYVLVLLVALATTVVAGVTVRRRQSAREATALAVLLAGVFVWLLGSLGELLASNYELTVAFAKASYLGITTIPAVFLVLAIQYTGRDAWLTRGTVLALAVEPVVVLGALVLSPDLIWSSAGPGDTLTGLVTYGGQLFWIHVVYSYALIAVGTLLFVELSFRSRHAYARQVVAILPGIGAPWLANVLYLSGVIDLDLTPVAFAVTGIALTWAVHETEFVDLTPVARDAVVDHVGHAVFVVDDRRRLTDVNPAGEALLGIDGSAIGTPLRDLLGEYSSLLDELAEGSRSGDRVVVDTPDGERVFDVDATALTDAQDRPRGTLLLVRDVTDQRRRERELERQNEQLDRFAAVVSHDLRTPLSVVKGYVELARENVDEPALEAASEGVDRMDRLLDDLLTLAREGRRIEETERVSLGSVAREAWADVRTPDDALVVAEDVTLQADRSRLRQALENLFRNAVEHSSTSPRRAEDAVGREASDEPSVAGAPEDAVEHGSTSPGSQARRDAVEHGSTNPDSQAPGRDVARGPATVDGTDSGQTETGDAPDGVTVEVGPIADQGFYVQDDGPGIPESERESVFEYGYSSTPDGTGLGLSIVDAIAEAHGWDLRLGDDGAGARFEFRDVAVGSGAVRLVEREE